VAVSTGYGKMIKDKTGVFNKKRIDCLLENPDCLEKMLILFDIFTRPCYIFFLLVKVLLVFT
jgi:hypothetical protein